MSDSVRARLGQQVVEYDWIQATINFTKLCGQKCNVFKGEDDTLDSKEANCLRQCARNAHAVKEHQMSLTTPKE